MNPEPRTFHLTLPVPDQVLSPNARPHWAVKRRAVKAARELAWGEARARWCWHGAPMRRVRLALFWTIIGRRCPDLDNLNASCKAYLDGIADAGVIADDSARTVVAIESSYCLYHAASERAPRSTVAIRLTEVSGE